MLKAYPAELRGDLIAVARKREAPLGDAVDGGATDACVDELGADESAWPVARLAGKGLELTPQTVVTLLRQ